MWSCLGVPAGGFVCSPTKTCHVAACSELPNANCAPTNVLDSGEYHADLHHELSSRKGVPQNVGDPTALPNACQASPGRYATMRYTWKHSAYSRFTLTPWTRARFQTYSGSA